MKAYGPVPSRRLGQSLGINHIPPKICSYSCIYCQLGNTIKLQCDRGRFFDPEEILKDVRNRIEIARDQGEKIDYLTFVPDGEPTLDVNLGREIRLVKQLEIDVAVIQNSSLLWMEDVRMDLMEADWVSMKVDAVNLDKWRRINRPHPDLDHETVLEGMREFANLFEGDLATETMLVRGLNDQREEIEGITDFLGELNPDKAYLAIPTRPPAEEWVRAPDERSINLAYQIVNRKLPHVEYLIGYEGNEFASSGDMEEDLLSITSVHPMREEGVRELLSKNNSDWDVIETLIEEGKIIELEYGSKNFYMRRIPSRT
jgi:wyosine [tRNA(Phe)-imidazoG37] synthetase (radical SAM superfamily)